MTALSTWDTKVLDFFGVYGEVTGNPVNLTVAARMVRDGWSRDLVESLDVLAGQAIARRTPFVAFARPRRSAWAHEQQVVSMLASTIERWANGRKPAQYLGWATIAALTPDRNALLDVLGEDPLLPVPEHRFSHSGNHSARTIDTWTWYTSPTLAPLAYAAGLSHDEARTRYAADDLCEEPLRTLAALRGYPMP